MDGNTILGCVLVVAALVVLTALTLWSRRAIRRIAKTGGQSLREIMRDMNGEP